MAESVLCVGEVTHIGDPSAEVYAVETVADAAKAVRDRDRSQSVVCVYSGASTGPVVDTVEAIRAASATVPILVWSDRTDGDVAIDAARAGATEYVSRDRLRADGETLADRIDALATAAEGASGPTEPSIELRQQTAALERLYEITSDGSRSFEEKIADLLELGCERLGLEIGYLSEIDDGRFRLMNSRGAEELLESLGKADLIDPDGSLPLDQTYCRRTVEHGELSGFARGAAGTGWDDDAYELFGLESYLGGPVVVDDELYGTLCFADEDARKTEFSDAERTFVELTVEWLSHEFERQKYDTERRETAAKLERTFDRVSDAIFAVDDEWNFTHVNGHAAKLLDRTPAELLGANVWDEFSDALGKQYEKEYRRAMRTQEPVSFEEYYEPLDLWTEVNAYPSEDGLSVFFRDITTRKRRERMLRGLLDASRELFRTGTRESIAAAIVETSVDILDLDINGVHLYDEDSGRLRPTATSDSVLDLVGQPPTHEVGDGLVGTVFERGVTETYDDISTVDGYEYGPVRSAIAVPLGTYGVFSVGSERTDAFDESDVSVVELLATTATEALNRAERLTALETYETVLETVDDMIYALDDRGRITHLTEPLAEWLGYDRAELIGEPITTVLPDGNPSAGGITEDSADGPTPPSALETVAVTASGECRPVTVSTSPLSIGSDRVGTVGSVDDIRELRKTKAELTVERDRFRELFERIPDPVIEATLREGRLEVDGVNSAFESVFGYDEDRLVGRSINDVIVPEAERESAELLDGKIRNDGVATSEVNRLTTTGTKQFLFRGFVYQSDTVDRAFGIYTDITERNERERYLRVTNRIIRHNLRNDLNVIEGFADILLADLDDERRIEYAERIRETAAELSTLGENANELRRVVGQDVGSELEAIRIDPLVAEACDSVVGQFPDAIINRSIPDATAASVDQRFATAVEYLVENAVEHNDGPEPRVSVTAADSDRSGFVELRVADDGPGIDRTTRELIVGDREITQLEHTLGIGLWVVKWVVESYGGAIEFGASDLGGTEVTLRVPA